MGGACTHRAGCEGAWQCEVGAWPFTPGGGAGCKEAGPTLKGWGLHRGGRTYLSKLPLPQLLTEAEAPAREGGEGGAGGGARGGASHSIGGASSDISLRIGPRSALGLCHTCGGGGSVGDGLEWEGHRETRGGASPKGEGLQQKGWALGGVGLQQEGAGLWQEEEGL